MSARAFLTAGFHLVQMCQMLLIGLTPEYCCAKQTLIVIHIHPRVHRNVQY